MPEPYQTLPYTYRARWCVLGLSSVWHATFTGKPPSREWLKNRMHEVKSACGSQVIVDGAAVREPNCPDCRATLADRYVKSRVRSVK